MKIAFASCARVQSNKEQKAWRRIAARDPDLLLLLGDNVYLSALHNRLDDASRLRRRLDGKYRRQMAVPSFRAITDHLRENKQGVLATWDDHDSFGNNRYGLDDDLVEAATSSFLRHMTFGAPRDTVHTARDFGDLARVVMLDVRSHRRKPKADVSRDAMLGADQWAWLENQIATATTRWVLVCSGTCFYGSYGGQQESWEQYGEAAKRLEKLLRRPGHVVLSGDIHKNAFKGLSPESGPIVELVSSGVARAADENFGILHLDDETLQVEFVDKSGATTVRSLRRDAWPHP